MVVGYLDGIISSKVKGVALPESRVAGKAGPAAGQGLYPQFRQLGLAGTYHRHRWGMGRDRLRLLPSSHELALVFSA